MGLPNINIAFKSTASSAIVRGQRGIVALILKDNAKNGCNEIQSILDVPKELSDTNQEQIKLALMGGQKPPIKVLAYVLPADITEYTEALTYFETTKFDYLVAPVDANSTQITSISTWIKNCRENIDKKVKAVLPNCKADYEGVINFATDDIKVGTTKYSAKQYCSRIAGILAGTPLTISATFQPLPEVSDVPRLTRSQLDSAIDSGQFLLFNDGEKVKIARSVNSLVTITQDKGATFKKIKVVDILDLIHQDIKKTAQDNYIGRFANSYDNKCLLIMAINGYYEQLMADGILDNKADNKVTIDLMSQRSYLKNQGIDTSKMTDQKIKEANTSDKVFLDSKIKPLDAIEEISLGISV